jgi:hypothetical protein
VKEAIVITESLAGRVPITLSASLTNKRNHLLHRGKTKLYDMCSVLYSYQNLKHVALNVSSVGCLYVIIKVLCKLTLKKLWWWLKRRRDSQINLKRKLTWDERHLHKHSKSERMVAYNLYSYFRHCHFHSHTLCGLESRRRNVRHMLLLRIIPRD